MIRSALRLAILAASIFAAHAQATTVSFTGTVDYAEGYNATVPGLGETVSGSYTFAAPTQTYSDGASLAYGQSYSGVSGSAKFSDGTKVSLAGGMDPYADQYVYRNYSGYLNEVGSYVESYQSGNYTDNLIELTAYDANGAGSTLFTNPNGGLSFSQGFNLANETSYAFIIGSTANGYFEDEIRLTSANVSAVPESTNAALLLAGLGLVTVVARKRRTQA